MNTYQPNLPDHPIYGAVPGEPQNDCLVFNGQRDKPGTCIIGLDYQFGPMWYGAGENAAPRSKALVTVFDGSDPHCTPLSDEVWMDPIWPDNTDGKPFIPLRGKKYGVVVQTLAMDSADKDTLDPDFRQVSFKYAGSAYQKKVVPTLVGFKGVDDGCICNTNATHAKCGCIFDCKE
jgi:hypothetical protein